MKRSTGLGALAGIVLAGGALIAPAAATPALADPHPAVDVRPECAVTDGTLTWGVKESFRSYISGSIAKGAWEVSDGASYETPNFGWSAPTGELSRADGTGNVSFLGGITFTGHGGLLNMHIANPTVSFAADGSARLLVDVRSNDTSGNVVIDQAQAELGTVGLPAPVEVASGTVEISGAPVTLTEAGVPAFGNFYVAGDALDPITLSFTLDCPVAEAPTDTDADADAGEDSGSDAEVTTNSGGEDGGSFPWVPVVASAAFVVVAAATAGVVAARRKKGAAAGDE